MGIKPANAVVANMAKANKTCSEITFILWKINKNINKAAKINHKNVK